MVPCVKILVLFFSCILTVYGVVMKKEFSLVGPFVNDAVLTNWEVGGATHIAPNFVRLTADEPSKKGAIWNKLPVLSNNWEIQMNFRITGRNPKEYGDGMAIWYTRDASQIGAVFGSRDYFSGVGIFIDTSIDPEHPDTLPYISMMVNNGSLRFLDAKLLGGCHSNVRNLPHYSKIAVSYSGIALSIFLDTEGQNQWQHCFTAFGVHLPTGYRVGVSASTDKVSDTHDILALTLLHMDPPEKDFEDRSGIVPSADVQDLAQSDEGVQDDEVEVEVEEEEEEEIRKEKERLDELVRLERERLQRQLREKKQQEELERAHKALKEKAQQELREKQAKEEKEKLEREARDKLEREERERQHKEAKEKLVREAKEKKERETKEKREREEKEKQAQEAAESKEEKSEEVEPSTSFTRKAIYVLAALIILLLLIRMYRRNSARRQESLHKRLY